MNKEIIKKKLLSLFEYIPLLQTICRSYLLFMGVVLIGISVYFLRMDLNYEMEIILALVLMCCSGFMLIFSSRFPSLKDYSLNRAIWFVLYFTGVSIALTASLSSFLILDEMGLTPEYTIFWIELMYNLAGKILLVIVAIMVYEVCTWAFNSVYLINKKEVFK